MSEANDDKKGGLLKDLVRPSTVIGAIFLAIASSCVYDLLVKPGLTTFGQGMLSVVTLGSRTLLNSVFASAASDPTPMTALLLLEFVAMGLIGVMVTSTASTFRASADSSKRGLDEKIAKAQADDPGMSAREILVRMRDQLSKQLARRRIVLCFLTFFGALLFITSFAMQSEAVAIWRKFNQNVVILAPKVQPAELVALRAQFASMRTAEDFEKLSEKMRALGNSSGTKLDSLTGW